MTKYSSGRRFFPFFLLFELGGRQTSQTCLSSFLFVTHKSVPLRIPPSSPRDRRRELSAVLLFSHQQVGDDPFFPPPPSRTTLSFLPMCVRKGSEYRFFPSNYLKIRHEILSLFLVYSDPTGRTDAIPPPLYPHMNDNAFPRHILRGAEGRPFFSPSLVPRQPDARRLPFPFN